MGVKVYVTCPAAVESSKDLEIDLLMVKAATGAVGCEGDRGTFLHRSPPQCLPAPVRAQLLPVEFRLVLFAGCLAQGLFKKGCGLLAVRACEADSIDFDRAVERDIDADLLLHG